MNPGRLRSRRRLRSLSVAGLVGALGLTLGVTAGPSGAGLPPDVRVIDSQGAAAVVGVLTRVPAESDGGAVYSSTSLTLDKTIARAAGFTPGPLGELFLESSSDRYRNPSLVTAQHPPTEKVPAEATVDGIGSPEGPPVAGRGGRFHTKATDTPSAEATATGAGGVGPNVTVASSASSSAGTLQADGTLVTRARSQATGVRIADVLRLASVTTVAEATVPRAGAPTTALHVTLAGMTLAGIPAEMTPDGLRISDQAPASPVSRAAFDDALAQLADRGITVSAAPLVQDTAAGAARAEGGALRIRYKVADQIGGDEEFTFAPASARSAVSRRDTEAEAPSVATDLPVDGPTAAGSAGAPAPRPATTGVNGAGSGADATVNAAGGAESLPFNGSPAFGTTPADPSTPSTSPAAGTPEGPAGPASITGTPGGPAGPDDLQLAAGRAADPAHKVRTGYAVVLLALVAGVAAVTVQFRIRTV